MTAADEYTGRDLYRRHGNGRIVESPARARGAAARGRSPVPASCGPGRRVASRRGAGTGRTGTVGELVRERRTSTGLTQRELAAAAGVSIGALRDLEQGRTRCPRWGTIALIAAALGMDGYEGAELANAWCGAQPEEGTRYSAVATQAHSTGAGVYVGVLGPLTAVRDGLPISMGPARQRAVLGLLALHWPAGVPTDVIIDVLWGGGHAPRSATAVVQAYVSRLRHLLEPGRVPRRRGGPVALADGRYRLGEGIGLDLAEFGQLSGLADAAAARGELHLACGLYNRSLTLWRCEPMADIDLLQNHPAIAEASRRRDDTVLRFVRVAAVAGRHELVLPHLRKLCTRDPLNEQAHALLMTALGATGHQAAALEVFSQLRRRLDSELGVRPGPHLAAAHLRVLRHQI